MKIVFKDLSIIDRVFHKRDSNDKKELVAVKTVIRLYGYAKSSIESFAMILRLEGFNTEIDGEYLIVDSPRHEVEAVLNKYFKQEGINHVRTEVC